MFKLLILLGRFRWLLLALPLGTGLLGLAASYALPVQYRTTVIIAGSKEVSAAVLKSLVESDRVRDHLIATFDLASRYKAEPGLATQAAFERKVAARPGRDGLLFISVTDGSADFAAKLADGVAAETIRAAHTSRLTATSQELARLRVRLDIINHESKEADGQLKALGVTDWRTVLPEADRSLVTSLTELQAELDMASRRARQGAPNTLLLQDQLLILQRALLERRSPATQAMSASAFELVRNQFFRAASAKRLEQEIATVSSEAADEIRQVAPAPIPLTKDSPKRLSMALAGFGAGLALVIAIAMILGEGGTLDPARAARMNALRRAWGFAR